MAPKNRIRPNYFYATLSLTLVLFLLGLAGMLITQAYAWMEQLKENVEVAVEFRNAASEQDMARVTEYLQSSKYTKAGSVSFLSKEESAQQVQQEWGEDIAQFGSNPLFDQIIFQVQSAQMHPDSLQIISDDLKGLNGVQNVDYKKELVQLLNRSSVRVFVILGILFLVLTGIAILLIHNTIRLALYANRFLIRNMQLVGAPWKFISRPYINRSLWNGLLSALLAILSLAAVGYLLFTQFPELHRSIRLEYVALVFGVMLLTGLVISGLSTRASVRKFLKMKLEDLY